MGVKGGVSNGTAEIHVRPFLNGRSVGVEMQLSKPKVHQVHLAPSLLPSQHKIRRLYVSVDISFVVDSLDGGEHGELRELWGVRAA